MLNKATRNLLNPSLATTTKNGVTCTNLSGGLEHNVVGLTNQVYSGLFSYPVAES